MKKQTTLLVYPIQLSNWIDTFESPWRQLFQVATFLLAWIVWWPLGLLVTGFFIIRGIHIMIR